MDENYIWIFGIIFVIVLAVYYAKRKKEKSKVVSNGKIVVSISDPQRKAKVEQAVHMILGTPWANYLSKHVYMIQDGTMTAVEASKKPAIFRITNKYIDQSSIKWLASVLVHEARHVEQTHDMDGYKGQQSELDANRVQLEVLRYLGGTQSEIRYLESADGLHFDTNNNGVLDPNDAWKY